MVNAQDWLNNKYPDKETEEYIYIHNEDGELINGSLKIADWPNLKTILLNSLSHHPPVISQIEISDCPQLKDIEMINGCINNIMIDNCSQITELWLKDNQLTNINEVISKLPNLRLLDVEGNQLVELDISHNTKLSYLSCDTQVQPIQTLVKTIQETETKLTDLQRSQNRKSEQITQLEQQIQSLKDLQKRLETQSQQKETELTTELNQLKQNKNELETKLRDHDNDLTTTRQQLDQIKFELTQKDQELTIAKNSLQTSQDQWKISDQKNQELEQQLTTFAVSTGLLTQQVENLTQQLTESQQQEERIRLEGEIKANLIREQNDKITQQEQQINNYQQLLRTSEENLKKCQQIINQKTNQLEQLEQEKELIAEELELASSKIKDLETALLSANGKIGGLEARIKELESKGDNSGEIERLKKELDQEKKKSQSEKTKSQLEIKRLQQELNQTKLREEELAEKIKELGKRRRVISENQETKSFWQTIKTPLFYTGRIILVVMALGWIYSQLQE